jgi:hypothetical protein
MCIVDEDCDCHLEDEDLGDEGDDDFDFDSDNIDGVGFANPGGNSSLRAATIDNPRNRPCPTCGRENVLTPIDEMRGYQCDSCSDAAEFGC